jgi:hypothetical protein
MLFWHADLKKNLDEIKIILTPILTKKPLNLRCLHLRYLRAIIPFSKLSLFTPPKKKIFY